MNAEHTPMAVERVEQDVVPLRTFPVHDDVTAEWRERVQATAARVGLKTVFESAEAGVVDVSVTGVVDVGVVTEAICFGTAEPTRDDLGGDRHHGGTWVRISLPRSYDEHADSDVVSVPDAADVVRVAAGRLGIEVPPLALDDVGKATYKPVRTGRSTSAEVERVAVHTDAAVRGAGFLLLRHRQDAADFAAGAATAAVRRYVPDARCGLGGRPQLRADIPEEVIVVYRHSECCSLGCEPPGDLGDRRELQWCCDECGGINPAEQLAIIPLRANADWSRSAPAAESIAAVANLGLASTQAQRLNDAAARSWDLTVRIADELQTISRSAPGGGRAVVDAWVRQQSSSDGAPYNEDVLLQPHDEGWTAGHESLAGQRPWEPIAVWRPTTRQIVVGHCPANPLAPVALVDTVAWIGDESADHLESVKAVAVEAAGRLRASRGEVLWGIEPVIYEWRSREQKLAYEAPEAEIRVLEGPLRPAAYGSLGTVETGWAEEQEETRGLSI